MRPVFSILLVLPAVVFCCDKTTHYEKNGECCKMCGPGTRMKQETNCHDPFCQNCNKGEYQSGYTKETECKRQPICDKNLNFETDLQQSTTSFQPCVCRSGYHCSDQNCMSCVQNTVCQPGQKIAIEGNRTLDTTCESCPVGTYSNESSAKVCKQWTECAWGQVEAQPGTSTSDRICEDQSHSRLGIAIVIVVIIVSVIVIAILYVYKKSRTGSACLEKKLQKHCPALFKVVTINAEPTTFVPVQPDEPDDQDETHEPQESDDTEYADKQEKSLMYGLSANGLPIDQDHSKNSILSESETLPSETSYTDRL